MSSDGGVLALQPQSPFVFAAHAQELDRHVSPWGWNFKLLRLRILRHPGIRDANLHHRLLLQVKDQKRERQWCADLMVLWSFFRQTVGVILGPRSGGPSPGAGLAHFNNFGHLGHQQHGPGREHAAPASSSGYQVETPNTSRLA